MRFIVGVFGKAGSGKSHLIQSLMNDLPRPVFVLDTQNEFDEGLQFEEAGVLLDYLVQGQKNASGIYVLKATADEDFDLFFRILATGQDPATLVIDEADLFCTPYNINEDFNRIIKYGRHWNQHILYAARRPAEVNRNLTAQSDCLISFKQTEPRDVAALKKSFSGAEDLADLDETKFEYMILGRSDHLPFAKKLQAGTTNIMPKDLTNIVPVSTLKSEGPDSEESEPGDSNFNRDDNDE